MSTSADRQTTFDSPLLDLTGLAEPARKAGIAEVVSKAQAWNFVGTIEGVVTLRLPQKQPQ